MSFFNLFRRKSKDPNDRLKIEFGPRGEGIFYQLPSKTLSVEFTWINGPRIYPESIARWDDNSLLTEEERMKVFVDVVTFLRRKRKRPIVVINADDSSKGLWESLCSMNQPILTGIEYTSNEERRNFAKGMLARAIRAGKSIVIDGIEITNERDLDEALRRRGNNHAV